MILPLEFPLKGLNKNNSVSQQPVKTSPDLLNVRPYDVRDNKARGGQRPALSKSYAEQLGSATANQAKPILKMVSVNITAFG